MAAKAKRIEETEFFFSVFEAERSLWDVKSKNYKDRDAKQRNIKNIAEQCDMSGKEVFLLGSQSCLAHSIF